MRYILQGDARKPDNFLAGTGQHRPCPIAVDQAHAVGVLNRLYAGAEGGLRQREAVGCKAEMSFFTQDDKVF